MRRATYIHVAGAAAAAAQGRAVRVRARRASVLCAPLGGRVRRRLALGALPRCGRRRHGRQASLGHELREAAPQLRDRLKALADGRVLLELAVHRVRRADQRLDALPVSGVAMDATERRRERRTSAISATSRSRSRSKYERCACGASVSCAVSLLCWPHHIRTGIANNAPRYTR